jgi:2-polyprenyl-6-methoxyphenol hydroxylase-like FAD-dependent oxidoreductase
MFIKSMVLKPKMKILISGAGIAGPTLAYWLERYGMEPTIVEEAPALRTGGYIIDFFGTGFEIADRMGLLPGILTKGYRVEEVRVVNREGQRVAGFSAESFWRAAGGRYTSLPRGDLAASIFGSTRGKIETIFGDSITKIEQSPASVHVTFEKGSARDFDLVVGADGLHSRVRELGFGPESQFEKYLGYKVAAFEAPGYMPRDELTFVMYTEVGQQVSRFTMRGDRTMFLFIFEDESLDRGNQNMHAQKTLLRKRFGLSGWECPQILNALDATDDLYFDRVSQIRMDPRQDQWTRGRVILVGDAASCVSLLAGQGSALAMIAAYILAGELHRSQGDYALAFRRYQELFAPFVLKEAAGCAAFCRLLCVQIKAFTVRSQSNDESDENSVDRRSCDRPRFC